MGYFSENYEKAEAPSLEERDYLKAEDFAGVGITVTFKEMKAVKADNADYGVNEVDWLFKSEKLKKGETFEYTFVCEDGKERVFPSKSSIFFISMANADPQLDDKVHIKREGEKRETKYFINVVN
jgi:hypothetical protein